MLAQAGLDTLAAKGVRKAIGLVGIKAHDVDSSWLHVIRFIEELENIVTWVVPCYCYVYSVASAEGDATDY